MGCLPISFPLVETLPGASSIAIASDKLRSKIEKLFGIDLNLSSCLIWTNLPILTSIGKLFLDLYLELKEEEERLTFLIKILYHQMLMEECQ